MRQYSQGAAARHLPTPKEGPDESEQVKAMSPSSFLSMSPTIKEVMTPHGVGLMVIVGMFLASLLVTALYGPTAMLRFVLLLLPDKPGWTWFFGWCSTIVVTTMLTLPVYTPLAMASGLVFGWLWGSVLNFIATMAAAILSIYLGRRWLQEPVREWLTNGDYPTLRRVMLVLEDSQEALKYQILFRFLYIPMAIRNYGPATLDIPESTLILGCVPHSLWISVMFSSVGASFKDVADVVESGHSLAFKDMRWQQYLVVFVSVLMTVALSWYAHQKYQDHVSKEEVLKAPLSGGSTDTAKGLEEGSSA